MSIRRPLNGTRILLWTLVALVLIAALIAGGCTTVSPANGTPTATVTATPCAVCGLTSTPNPRANLTVEEQQLVAFVADAAAYARSNGREAVLALFNDRNGSFVQDDLYTFAYDVNGTSLAAPFQPELLGTNRLEAMDNHGTKIVREGIAAARNGSGFQELWYPNPVDNGAVEPKTVYVVGMGDWFLGSGYYGAQAKHRSSLNLLSKECLDRISIRARLIGSEIERRTSGGSGSDGPLPGQAGHTVSA